MKKIFLFSLFMPLLVQAQDPIRHEELGYKYLFPDKFAIDIKSYIKDNGGVKTPQEIIELKNDENNLKDLVHFKAEKYSIYYSKCYELYSSAAEFENPKTSPEISLLTNDTCKSAVADIKKYETKQLLLIGFDPIKNFNSKNIYESLDDKFYMTEETVYKQKFLINGRPAFLKGIVQQSNYKLQIKLKISLYCNNNLFYFSYFTPSGEATNEIVKKGTYEIPEDFKQIISSFKCNEKPSKKIK